MARQGSSLAKRRCRHTERTHSNSCRAFWADIAWDVVNEAIGDNSKFKNSLWLNALGPGYIRLAFGWAHDPQAKLFYNDYGGEALGPKSDAIYNLLRTLKARETDRRHWPKITFLG